MILIGRRRDNWYKWSYKDVGKLYPNDIAPPPLPPESLIGFINRRLPRDFLVLICFSFQFNWNFGATLEFQAKL